MAHSVRVDPAARSRIHHSAIIGPAATIGGASVVSGAFLPWLTVFQGLRSYSGLTGSYGRTLAVAGAVATLLAIAYGVRPRPLLRYAIGIFGFALAVFSAYLLAQLLETFRHLQGVYLPGLGPGLPVAAGGALLLTCTLFIPIDSTDQMAGLPRLTSSAAALIALSAGAGTIHLAVAAEHFTEFALYGAFFIALGIAQIAWAVVVAMQETSRPLLLIALGNLLVAWLWVASRTTGLPIAPQPWLPESVGLAGVVSTGFEVILVGWAAWSLWWPRRTSQRLAAAVWGMPVVVGGLTILAIIVDVGGHGHSS